MAKITNTNSTTKAILSFLDVYGNTVNIPYGQTESADINETTRAKLVTLNNVVDGVAYGTTVSGSGLDQNTTGATLNGATNQLTLTGDDGMAPVNVDLTALKAVSVADSLTGDGTAATPVKLVGDLTTPGNDKYYGTDTTGTRGWFIHTASAGHRVVADRNALAALTDLKKGEQVFVEVDFDYGNSWTIWQVKADAATWPATSAQILILDKQDSKNFDYAPGKAYVIGDLVTYSFSGYQLLIRCSIAHTAPLAGVQSHPDWTKWIIIAQNTPLPDIPSAVIIPVGLTAYVNGRPHYCNTSYTSTGNFQVERVNWNVFEYNHPTTWAAGKYYAPQEHGSYTYTGPCYIVFRNPFSGLNDGFTTGATWNTEDPLKYNYYQLVSQNMYPEYADVANQRVLQRFVVKYNDNLYASKTNFIVPTIFDVLDWDVIVKGGKYKGLYSNTLPYEANDTVIDASNVLWKSNFSRSAGTWSLAPTEGIAANQFTRLTGKDKGVFNFQNNYVIDDVVYDSTSTIGNNPGWYRATAAHSSGNAPAAVNWSSLALGSNRVHLSDTSVAPAIGGQPTLAEITASLGFFIPSPPRDTILHYTGDDSPASVTTHVYHVDRVGNITPLSSGGVSEFIGADTLTAGQAGTVPAPAIGNDQRFLASNGIWKEVDKTIPEWAPFLPTQIGKLWRINVGSVYLLLMSAINGVTNGALNSSEYANMILLAQSSIDGHPENKSVPKGFKFNFGGKIWQATTPRDVPAGFPTVALTGFESIGEGNLARASLSIAGLAHVVGTHVENNHPGAVTVTLPSGIDGCRLRYTDGAGVTSTFTTIISPAPGERLMGSVGQQYLLNWAGGSVTFVYFSAARGWIVE